MNFSVHEKVENNVGYTVIKLHDDLYNYEIKVYDDMIEIFKYIYCLLLEHSSSEIEMAKKNIQAVSLGRLGGQVGGKSRAAKLSPERRKEIAKLAAQKRWGKKNNQ